jgi:hypothetical protein
VTLCGPTSWSYSSSTSLGGGLPCCHMAQHPYRLLWLHLSKRRAPVPPIDPLHVATLWLHLPKRWAPMPPCVLVPMLVPLALPLRGSGATTWPSTHAGSIGSTSLRDGLPCYHMAPCPWAHSRSGSTSPRDGFRSTT